MRATRRLRWMSVMCRTVCVVLASLPSACSSKEPSGGPTPVSPALTIPTTASSTPSSPSLQLSGRARDEGGASLADVTVAVDYYGSAGSVSSPPSMCHPTVAPFCWLSTRTNGLGEYSVEFSPQPWPGHGLGYAYAFRSGYETNVQWVPVNSSPAILDLRMRATRAIHAGESSCGRCLRHDGGELDRQN